jgi:hypothetical protein
VVILEEADKEEASVAQPIEHQPEDGSWWPW